MRASRAPRRRGTITAGPRRSSCTKCNPTLARPCARRRTSRPGRARPARPPLGHAAAAQPVSVPWHGGGVPPCAGQALQPAVRADAGSRRTPGGLPRRDGLRAVRQPADPGAAPGRGLFLQPRPPLLHHPVDHDVSQHPRQPAAGDPASGRDGVGPAARRAGRGSPAERVRYGLERSKREGMRPAAGVHGRQGYPRGLQAGRQRPPHAVRGRRAGQRPGAGAARDRQQDQ